MDLVFQSVAGTQKANESFGVSLALLAEARDAALSLKRGTAAGRRPPNVMYFETGQGSALSAGAHHGVDQQTCEARAYAVARHFSPLLVNTVVGFIGPEYLYDGKQIIRAGLEDHFCGKLLGLPMGCDVCYTNHAEADQNDMDTLLTLLGVAGCNYVMGVPGADDVMLGYQSTSFHDSHYLRQVLGLRPAPEFEAWLEKMQLMREVDGRPRLLPVAPPPPAPVRRMRDSPIDRAAAPPSVGASEPTSLKSPGPCDAGDACDAGTESNPRSLDVAPPAHASPRVRAGACGGEPADGGVARLRRRPRGGRGTRSIPSWTWTRWNGTWGRLGSACSG